MSKSSEQSNTNQSVFLQVLFAILTAFSLWPFLQALSDHLVKPVLAVVLFLPDGFNIVVGQTFEEKGGDVVAVSNVIAIISLVTEFMAAAAILAMIYLAYRVVRRFFFTSTIHTAG